MELVRKTATPGDARDRTALNVLSQPRHRALLATHPMCNADTSRLPGSHEPKKRQAKDEWEPSAGRDFEKIGAHKSKVEQQTTASTTVLVRHAVFFALRRSKIISTESMSMVIETPTP